MRTSLSVLSAAALCAVLIASVGVHGRPQAPDARERVDYLTFAQGAVPVRIAGATARLGVGMDKAVEAIDGNPGTFVLSQKSVTKDTDTEFIYRLPAATTFDRFVVPSVLETPSPSQTFTRVVEVHGSSVSADEGFELLASATLTTHRSAGLITELKMTAPKPVRFVKVRLVGGIDVQRDNSFFEFSEIIGNGTQEVVPLAEVFSGAWQTRGVSLTMTQAGAAVSGCYDSAGVLEGTVTGGLLRAVGVDSVTKVPSHFLLTMVEKGVVLGVRSTNGAPFRVYTAPPVDAAKASCPAPPPPTLGCGDVIHGISFEFDSAEIRPESTPVLAMLFEGLKADASQTILIEGHTSSEGTDAYNKALSERRAQAVVADLVRRGITAGRLTAAGAGESRPMASNADESGRSMNRRVEIRCS